MRTPEPDPRDDELVDDDHERELRRLHEEDLFEAEREQREYDRYLHSDEL